MEPSLDRIFLEFSAKKLLQLGARIEDCLGRLTEEQIWMRGADSSNAIGNLVLHLCGNLRQWIGHGVAGMPDERVRDLEFAARGDLSGPQLSARLSETLHLAAPVIESVSAQRLTESITVQAYTMTVMEAIYHVVEHFAQHTGQIMFATKLATSADLGYYKHLQGSVPHGAKTP